MQKRRPGRAKMQVWSGRDLVLGWGVDKASRQLLSTSPARQSTAQDIAEWRAARRKRRRAVQETRDLATARALLDIAGQLDPLVRMP